MAESSEVGGSALRRGRWRWVAWPVGVVGVLAALGSYGWFRWFPDHRPELRSGERYGIDVSNHQGDVDWGRGAGDDIEFAYVKATEGGDHVDDRFHANWMGADAAGLDRGAYHFFTLCRPGADQAANFLKAVPEDPDALPPAVDLELAGNCADRPSRSRVEREVRAFIDAVEAKTGRPVVLYLGDDFEGRYHLRDDLDRPDWRRRILLRPRGDRWWIWQVSGEARVDGIDGPTDLDVMRGTAP